MLEETLESPLDSKIKPVNSKGNQPWTFNGKAYAVAEIPTLWPPDAKSQPTGKGLDAKKDQKGMTEDEIVGWHHQLNGHEFEQALGDGEGQGSLVSHRQLRFKELDTIELLNNTKERVILDLLCQQI